MRKNSKIAGSNSPKQEIFKEDTSVELALELLQCEHVSAGAQLVIAQMGDTRLVKKLLKRADLTAEAQLAIAKSYSIGVVSQLLKREDLATEVQCFIAESENKRLIHKLLERVPGGVCFEAQRLIAKRGDHDLLLRLMGQYSLDNEVQCSIARTRDEMLISILVMEELSDEAKMEVIMSGSSFIDDLIKEGNLNDHHLAEIIKLGEPELNAKLIEALSGDKDRAFVAGVLKQGKPERIEVLIQFLEADQKEELEDAIVNIFRVFDAK
jgi:hypothetical protein